MAFNNATVRFQGTQATIEKLKKFGRVGENRIKAISQATATQIVTDASIKIQSYPGDIGFRIAQSISASKHDNGLTWFVSVNEVPMAAYIEFGTGTFVEVPPGWEETAWQFYVNGKGYLRPFPYLYPAYYKARRQYKKDLQESLLYLTNAFNRNTL